MILHIPAMLTPAAIPSLISAVITLLALGSGSGNDAAKSSVTHRTPPVLDTALVDRVMMEEIQRSRSPGASVAVVIGDRIAYAKGYGSTSAERAILESMVQFQPEAATPNPLTNTPLGVAEVAGAYVAGGDTLRLTRQGAGLRYRYLNGLEQPASVENRNETVVRDSTGAEAQRFMVVRGRSGAMYLHDGLNAWRRMRR